jgi:membrane protein required for beta-lactamase induction
MCARAERSGGQHQKAMANGTPRRRQESTREVTEPHLSTEGGSLRSKDRNLQILIATMERERLFARFFWVCLGMVALMQLIGLG